MRIRFILFLLLFGFHAYAQKEAINWYFGHQVGLSFASGKPVPLPAGAMKTYGGSAVMSDKSSGQLLFYTNGRNIWNRNHQLMPNGQDFPASCTNLTSQPALIVPVPGTENRFYVFASYFNTAEYGENHPAICITHPAQDYTLTVKYSIVDIKLDNGLGDVVADRKNILLQQDATEKLTAIPHSNGRDFWLLTHAWNSNAFYVYLISDQGISFPLVQHIGATHNATTPVSLYDEAIKGMMKASPNGRKLAVAVPYSQRPLDLFDFDPSTGMLSNYLPLASLRGQYGVSFSPDNTKLYATTDNRVGNQVPDHIWQFDLLAGDAQAISASGIEIIRRNPYTNMPQDAPHPGFHGVYVDLQLAPDGRLYAVSSGGHPVPGDPDAGRTMVVINKPNERGYACDVNYSVFDFETEGVAWGLPNFIQSYFNGLEPALEEVAPCSPGLVIYPNPTQDLVSLVLTGQCTAPFSLQVINAIGQQVKPTYHGLSSGTTINLAGMADGMYLFVFTFPAGKVTKRIIKIS